MILKDLVLTSLETLKAFEVNGKTLDNKSYEDMADKEIKNYYLDIKENKPYIVVELED